MFVVVGEALVDLVGRRGDRTFVAHPGGSPANVALGLARLGDPVTLVTRLGPDRFGEMISQHLTTAGVHVDAGAARTLTSMAIATLDDGAASYDFRIDWDLQDLASLPPGTVCLHTGSLATVVPPGNRHVARLMAHER